jgi:GNAT superfamily N-acetyltransferase
MEARTVPADQPPASDLLAAVVAELNTMYGDVEAPGFPTATATDLGPPHGAFVVVFDDDGTPVAGGGLKRLGDGLAEIKRMYVIPAARGRGIARTLLSALEHAARELGYVRVRLDTGARQPHAQRLYESAGYVAIDNYNDNDAAAFWGEKNLVGG